MWFTKSEKIQIVLGKLSVGEKDQINIHILACDCPNTQSACSASCGKPGAAGT